MFFKKKKVGRVKPTTVLALTVSNYILDNYWLVEEGDDRGHLHPSGAKYETFSFDSELCSFDYAPFTGGYGIGFHKLTVHGEDFEEVFSYEEKDKILQALREGLKRHRAKQRMEEDEANQAKAAGALLKNGLLEWRG